MPATGAEVRLQAALAAAPLWQGRADTAGLVRLTERLGGGLLLARHPGAGFLVRPRQATAGVEEPKAWTLPPAAAPLDVRVVDAAGEPSPWAQLALWVEELRLEGPALAWLLDTRPAAGRDGTWQGRHLPARPLRLLAWTPAARERAVGGALDLLAWEVPYPWGPVVDVTVAE